MKKKNFNRTTAHRKAMFNNMIKDFKKLGHLTTTTPRAKKLKQLLEKSGEVIHIFKVGFRKGDNAQMSKLISKEYLDVLNPTSKKTKSTTKSKSKKSK